MLCYNYRKFLLYKEEYILGDVHNFGLSHRSCH